MTFDAIVRIGVKHPDVVESTSWGTPSLKRKGKFMLRLKEGGDALAVKLDWDEHDRLLAAYPKQIYKTAHYDGYPAFLLRLENLDDVLAEEVVRLSWENALHPAKTFKKP